MSLESALDEERLEVMALLEGRALPRPNQRTASPGVGRAVSPAAAQSPVRSIMLDMSPPSSTRSQTVSNISPPPIGRTVMGSPKLNPEQAYQFEMLPSIESHALPKRVSQGGKKKGAMAGVFGNQEQRDAGRHNSTTGILGNKKSMSPSSRLPGRSESPGVRRLNNNSFNLMPDPGKYVSDSGKVVDMTSAYRRLSDAALLRSGGSLANLPTRKGSDPAKGVSAAPGGGVRLQEDYYEEDGAVESSDEDAGGSEGSSDEDGWGSEKRRGRRRTRRKSREGDVSESPPGPSAKEARKPKSLLAAAEAERKDVSSTYKVRSLLEPTISITGPDGELSMNKKAGVHPTTSFDQGGSGVSTPMNSDTEADISDIKRAQRMALTMSPITSTPEAHRCVRTIIRGEYAALQREAELGLRRQRVYLVATDLSEEAAYALEWTIGTVLRDGDTLLAVYAIDEEAGTGVETSGVGIGEGAEAMKDANSLVKTLSHTQDPLQSTSSLGPSPLSNSVDPLEADKAAQTANMREAERERYNAAAEVSCRCVKLLRKTKLQVRVVIEVFHCKSPKHMITEVIDFLDPTLVILGSRGRSALKGVLLGSFSNYLVTKSSVPVMVARKRLRKHSKYKRTNLRLSNVLAAPTGGLANAKVD
ncbi:adenine nucleotide alpha hydrolases-like protein [Patellaria atrata CBS 101060]|uniref:Adenine nucleotide alpha hydrolases-like protein n=1 Tax=Patellaria atrata CBS 101060 TaxID=1346257 RepID=A0A9P4SFB9_9PEZI|nr:adenine nucleotide alpha hydrolases-like protein [Patellaria atrata CBS 101060]